MAVQEMTSADFEQAVTGNELALFDFYATWCGPCKAFGPIFDKASDANPDMFFGRIDIDKNQDLANAANIQAVPTLMIVKKGHVIYQEAGALRAADLDDLISQAKALDVDAALAEAKADGADQNELLEEQEQ
ncbi:thioredoxin family protein [Bifidobacterium canis]|uniref:Thioredoxin n=1 Tax=Bifidobacterium canis TaxID=2610880 RepID=A0A7K1J5D2_9BIFI|nr:thioredoxin family protein [Bifidobacterium canis]MUH59868.1 thioredoxin [Bifidobacterium canis]